MHAIDTLERRRLLSGLGIDTTYGTNGRAALDATTPAADYTRRLIRTSANKLLVAGDTGVSTSIAHLTQFNLDGALDPNFGAGGKRVLSELPPNAGIIDAAIDSASRITVLANAKGIVARRFFSNGAIDTSFSLNDATTNAFPTDLAISSTGVFAVAAQIIFKYDPATGVPDTSWDGDGQLNLANVTTGIQFVPKILQPLDNGQLLVGGTYGQTSAGVRRAAFRLYASNGTLITSVGTSGTLQVGSYLSDSSTPTKFLVQSPTQVIVSVSDTTTLQDQVLRINTNSLSFDSTFNLNSGRFTTNLSSTLDEGIADITLDNTGRIVGSARVQGSTLATNETALFRLTFNGSLDINFGGAGYTRKAVATSSDIFDWGQDALTVGDASDVLYLATATQTFSTGVQDQYLYRVPSAGGIDSTFGGVGRVRNAYDVSVNQAAYAARGLSDGSVVFVGGVSPSSEGPALVGKIGPGGEVATFGTNGITQIDFGGHDSLLTDIVVSGSKLVAGGQVTYFNNGVFTSDFALTRLNADGTFDSTFGSGGKFVFGSAGSDYERINRVSVDANGLIYATGVVQSNGLDVGAILRVLPNGTLDTSYGTSGVLKLNTLFSDGPDVEIKYIEQRGGKLLIAGAHSFSNAGFDTFVAMLNADGTRFTDFGTGGVVRFTSGGGYPGVVRVVNDVSSGRFLVVEQAEDANYVDRIYIRRFDSLGVLDASYGTAGVASIPLNDADAISDAELLSDGNLLIAGRRRFSTSATATNVYDYLFVGVTNAGQLDTNFGLGGYQTLNQTKYDAGLELFRNANGALLLAGTTDATGSAADFAAIRLIQGVDVTPPTIAAIATSQTSRSIVLTFSESVLASLSKSDLIIYRRGDFGGGYLVDPSLWSFSASDVGGKTVATLTLSAAVIDADYNVYVTSGTIADANGNANASLASPNVFFLAGDINHDRTVNFDDLVILAQNYNKTGLTFSQGNLDYSPGGEVNFEDLVILAQQYNKLLAMPAVVAAKVTPLKKAGPAIARVLE